MVRFFVQSGRAGPRRVRVILKRRLEGVAEVRQPAQREGVLLERD